ncbi:hypothetical protein LEP1GSC050_1344 [Leptospira broomii serovar Hurstbridge str. 5399]|uniref:Uncharacterized protein n=1 Tax=Leptospira broomii serovar Hurstbridge str. 5399 TaxID=1049789 RepID=T0F5K2_9LEPT|nr:hypothetical protein LEP1GSC050_1344 [Leptospira broomii serovar Hurstbridge str. 5399]
MTDACSIHSQEKRKSFFVGSFPIPICRNYRLQDKSKFLSSVWLNEMDEMIIIRTFPRIIGRSISILNQHTETVLLTSMQ